MGQWGLVPWQRVPGDEKCTKRKFPNIKQMCLQRTVCDSGRTNLAVLGLSL